MTAEVIPVQSRKDLNTFIKLPFSLYADDSNWVPPLISERKRFLSRNKNPFFEHAKAEFFLARRDGKVVGSIAACVDSSYDKIHGDTDGTFGFFECINDADVAGALLDAAIGWLRENRRTRMLGPFDFNQNHKCGLLVEGNHKPPYIMMPYHHGYYADLLEGQGLTKTMDLLGWSFPKMEGDNEMLQVLHELADESRVDLGITVRQFDKKDFKNELSRFFELYNDAWKGNWGYVPLTEEEIKFMGAEMKHIIMPPLALFAEKDGEVVGAMLCLPNINEILSKIGGRLLPLGWLKLLRGIKQVRTMQAFIIGVKSEYQQTGVVAAALLVELSDNMLEIEIDEGEMGWTLETNKSVNRICEAMGGDVIKRYRIYDKDI